MLITNARIYTMENEGIIENGYLLIKDGKIADAGKMKNAPQYSGETLDANGLTLLPGFIDGHCHLGMWEDSLGFEGDDGNEDTDPSMPHLRAIDAVNPFDRCFDDALSAGITTVVTGPGSANPIGGQFAALKTGGKTIEDKLLKTPVSIKAAFGENPKSVHHSKNQAPVTRMATAAIIREQLFKAQRYKKDLDKSMSDADFEEPEYDMKCEAVLPLLERDIPLHAHAHRADDIMTAARIAKEFNINLSIIHGTDGCLLAEYLAKNNISVLFGPALCERSKPEQKNLSFKTAGILQKAGVLTAIITDHPETPVQYLPLCAALAVKEGMDYLEALKAITINPAIICGIEDRTGSIKKGKDADIIIFDGDPLSIIAECRYIFINGERVK